MTALRWRLVATAWLLLALAQPAGPANAHELNPDRIGDLGFEPHPGAQVPLELAFRDESGQPVTLGAYFGTRPVILTLNYLSCPNLCPLMLRNLAGDLDGLPFTLGEQYTVLTVSIDPRDTPALAAHARQTALGASDHPETAAGWKVLTGTHANIDRLADAVGFRYAYDADQDEYAHPAGVIVLTPDGKVSRYLYGLDYSPLDLRLALVEAAERRIGSLVDQALLLCYHYEARTGRYTPLVLNAVRGLGAATVLGLGGFLGLLWRADLRRRREQGETRG
jgi:protein SCO1/2